MADQEGREPAENAATDSSAVPASKSSLPQRVWAWFSAQGLVAKFIVTILTAVTTALVVGVVTRSAFGGGSDTPTSTTLARDAAPFSVSTRIIHGDYWKVWLEKPLPDPGRWPEPGADPDAVLRFVNGLGAVDGNITWVRIVLDGTAGRTSTITGARAVVVKRLEPSPVASFTFPHEGEEDVIGWYFNLDEPGSPAQGLVSFATPSGKSYFANRTITVAPSEAITIDVNAATQTCDCLWVIELEVVVDGTPRTVRVDNDGKPFHTSAGRDGVPAYIWASFTEEGGIQLQQPDGKLVPAAP